MHSLTYGNFLQLSRRTTASVKGSSANIDMANLELGRMLGKGSFGFVKLVSSLNRSTSVDVAELAVVLGNLQVQPW